ncbi:MAG: hypothetical protein ACXABK_07310 [Candidatus Heimdallarchaeaceae archaeon]|jgi:hypothetical protein
MSRNIPIKVERNEDVPNFYAESIQMVHSIAGFKMIIFRDKAEYAVDPSIGPDALIPRSIIKEIIAEVSFSPQQLKILAKVIGDQIKAFESRFGEITLPEQSKKKDNISPSYI